jgi:single-stranded-DNA-specific exonuclease
LQALRRVSQREGKSADAGEVGFQLAPRLNAAGRLGSAGQSVALLTTVDPHEANELAQVLDRVNQERRDMQRAIEDEVHERITRQYGLEPPAAIVLGDASWHHGIVGIVAARIAEKYHRPTFLLQIQDGVARGSGRSIPAFDLYRGLQHCAQWLQRYGGHKYAAGLTMDAAQLPYLQEEFIRYADDILDPSDLEPTLALDAIVPLQDITLGFIEQMEALAPYGAGNPTPVLGAYNVRIASTIRCLGQQGQHAKFQVRQGSTKLEVIAFQQADHVQSFAPETPLDIAFTPLLNTWQGRYNVELQLRALRPHHPANGAAEG